MRRGRIEARYADHGGRKVRRDADSPRMLDDVEFAHLGFVDRRGVDFLSLAVSLYVDRQRLAGAAPYESRHFREALDLLTVDSRDSVPWLELSVGGLARNHHADGRRQELVLIEKDRSVQGDRKEEIHGGAREHYRHALPKPLRLERPSAFLGQDGLGL